MRMLFVAAIALAPLVAFAMPDTSRAQQAMAMLNQRFDAADANHDGKLTQEEAKAGMPRVAEHFDEIDADHKGYITKDQIVAFMKANAGR
jgi:Ca2+-binding EF-hand superfamily protein